MGEVWTTICSDHWSYNDASVVCNQLGYSPYGIIIIIMMINNYVYYFDTL